jgi:hypothetical protein
MRRGYFGAALAAMACIAATGAVADAADDLAPQYKGCDGYGPAREDSDGMTTHWTLWGMRADAGTNTPEKWTAKGPDAIADCDRALAALGAKHWLRKASLLRARALHKLETRDIPAAMADLDAADATLSASGDVYAIRSLGLGVRLARAFALHLSGEQAKAEAMAMAAMAERPYNRQVLTSTRLAIGTNASPANLDAIKRALARLVPSAVDEVFSQALKEHRYADAIALYPELTPYQEIGQLNIGKGGFRERDLRDFQRAEIFWAVRGGDYAYVLAASGKPAEARAAMKALRERIAQDTAPPPPVDSTLSGGDYAKAMAFRDEIEGVHKRTADATFKLVDEWTWIVEARALVAEGKTLEAWKSINGRVLPPGLWASTELNQAIFAHPVKGIDASASKLAVTNPNDNKITTVTVAKEPAGATMLFKVLPEAETRDRVPDNVELKSPFPDSDRPRSQIDSNGYRVQADATGSARVGVFADKGTMSMVEELAMLHAAEVARQAGKKGILVVKRQDVYHELDTYYYGRQINAAPTGMECDFNFVAVDPAALPDAYRGQGWRVIDADAAYAALAPVYLSGAAPKGTAIHD